MLATASAGASVGISAGSPVFAMTTIALVDFSSHSKQIVSGAAKLPTKVPKIKEKINQSSSAVSSIVSTMTRLGCVLIKINNSSLEVGESHAKLWL